MPDKSVSDVFGISSSMLPDSYVDRGDLDRQITTLLSRPTHIALRGESKCGKSWLRKKNIENAIIVQCRLGRTVSDIYVDALSQLDIRLILDLTRTGSIAGTLTAEAQAGADLLASIFGLQAGAKAEIHGNGESSSRHEQVGHNINGLHYIADIIKASGKRLVIEDYHYMTVDERKAFSFDLKTLWDYGLFVEPVS